MVFWLKKPEMKGENIMAAATNVGLFYTLHLCLHHIQWKLWPFMQLKTGSISKRQCTFKRQKIAITDPNIIN